jgi:hypothetical protein
MSKKAEMTSGAFERKIIGGMCEQIEEHGSYNTDIYGTYKDIVVVTYRGMCGKIDENGSYNNDICSTHKDIVVVTFIRLGRLEWAGHICRMDGSRTPRKIFE